MTIFIVSVTVVLILSALCSLAEASIYAVSVAYVRQRAKEGSRSGRILSRFKDNMEQPITAILIVNTVANTAGAAIAGSQARAEFGEESLIWFSAVFTVSVLLFSEIIPKVLGVAYSRGLSDFLSRPLLLGIRALYPVVWMIQQLTRLLQRGSLAPQASEAEVHEMAMMSAEEGSILPMEADLVENVLRLDDLSAHDIMTPRSVVVRVNEGTLVKDLAKAAPNWAHSRLPVCADDDPEKWVGVVLQREILACLARDEFETPIKALAKPLLFVPDTTRGDKLLGRFVSRRSHLLGVTDEYGSIAGIVTLEDVTEALIGAEIVDETDVDVDMQVVARRRLESKSAKAEKAEKAEEAEAEASKAQAAKEETKLNENPGADS